MTIDFDRRLRGTDGYTHGKQADAAYIRLAEGYSFEPEDVGYGVILDFDQSGKLLAVGLLEISKNIPGGLFSKVEVLTA